MSSTNAERVRRWQRKTIAKAKAYDKLVSQLHLILTVAPVTASAPTGEQLYSVRPLLEAALVAAQNELKEAAE